MKSSPQLSRGVVRRQRAFDIIFLFGLLMKAVDGFIEFVIGGTLFFISPDGISDLVQRLTAGELLEDPHDLIANLLVHSTNNLNRHMLVYAAIYLTIHGAIKLVIIAALLRNRVRIYPWALLALSLLVIYQIYAIILRPSAGLIALTIFDAIVIALTTREWREHRTVGAVWRTTRNWLAPFFSAIPSKIQGWFRHTSHRAG